MSRDTPSIDAERPPNAARDSGKPLTFRARPCDDTPTRAQTIFDVCFGIVLPVARSLPELAGADATRAGAAARRLRLVGRVADADLDRLVLDYAHETDAARRDRLARVYREATGRDIERRLAILSD